MPEESKESRRDAKGRSKEEVPEGRARSTACSVAQLGLYCEPERQHEATAASCLPPSPAAVAAAAAAAAAASAASFAAEASLIEGELQGLPGLQRSVHAPAAAPVTAPVPPPPLPPPPPPQSQSQSQRASRAAQKRLGASGMEAKRPFLVRSRDYMMQPLSFELQAACPGGSRWIQVDPGGSRWIPVDPSGSRSPVAPCREGE